ncbi:MAG TPA: aldehyde dehydrogenase [Gammaproteobacteria bacterium]|nr:aldehyde dehydrogenase [Gammaproteobacteria bacterium]
MKKYQLFINGEWQNPDNNEWFDTINPYTNKVWASIPRSNEKDVDRACTAASLAFKIWARMHPNQRAAILRKFADILSEKSKYLAEIETKDNGKLFAETYAQTKYLPQYFYFYAGLGETIMGNMVNVDKPKHMAYTLYEPLGVIVTITAWNSPLMLVTWKIAPALAAGNTVVIKPSEYTSATAFELAKIAEEAGFPPGVINVISGFGSEIGNALITHPTVAKISFTGGTKTGAAIYSEAAKHIKKVSVELGGKSPNIVFNDANLDNAVKGAISGIFAASGQTCIAGSRLLLEESIHDEFVEKLVTFAKTAKLGDPMNADTQVGPLTTPDQFKKILGYIDIAKNEDAKCVLGGKSVELNHCPWFIEPTIFTHVKNNMRIAQEEVFGPVLAIIKFKGMDEAIEIANDIPFGLAAGVWTEDIKKAMQIPKEIKAGTVWVNTYRMISYLLPFGGYKQSGMGRENGINVIYDYLQEKSVFLSLEESTANPFVLK